MDRHFRHFKGPPGWVLLCSAARQAFDGPASLLFRCGCWPVGGERLWWCPHPLCMTQQYHPASMAAWLSSTGIPVTVSSLTSPRSVSPQSTEPSRWDCSTVSQLQLPAAAPFLGPASLSRLCVAAARTVWFSFHSGCHRSAVSLLALHVSPLTQTVAPMWGSDPCFSSPRAPRAGPVLWTLLFSP